MVTGWGGNLLAQSDLAVVDRAPIYLLGEVNRNTSG
jgi:hypothetical protein